MAFVQNVHLSHSQLMYNNILSQNDHHLRRFQFLLVCAEIIFCPSSML